MKQIFYTTAKPPEAPAAQQPPQPPKDTATNAVNDALAKKYEETDDFVCNDPYQFGKKRKTLY